MTAKFHCRQKFDFSWFGLTEIACDYDWIKQCRPLLWRAKIQLLLIGGVLYISIFVLSGSVISFMFYFEHFSSWIWIIQCVRGLEVDNILFVRIGFNVFIMGVSKLNACFLSVFFSVFHVVATFLCFPSCYNWLESVMETIFSLVPVKFVMARLRNICER